MAPYLEEIQKEMKATVTIVRINADNNRALAAQLKVNALPTLLLYKNKAMVWSNTGFQTKEEIKLHLTKK
jgi:thioredoxin 1